MKHMTAVNMDQFLALDADLCWIRALEGLKAASAKVLVATWQRCRVHFMRNALAHAHKGQREMIAAMIRTAFAQPDYDAAVLQWRQVADNLRPKVEKLAALMDAAEADVLAFMTFPKELCHLDYGYAVTIQRAQGATAYPILNAPSYRVNTIHLTSAYVGVSRAPGAPFIVTDSRVRLIRSLGERVGLQSAALDQAREDRRSGGAGRAGLGDAAASER